MASTSVERKVQELFLVTVLLASFFQTIKTEGTTEDRCEIKEWDDYWYALKKYHNDRNEDGLIVTYYPMGVVERTWTIYAPPDYRIKLVFDYFRLSEGNSRLSVYDGPSDDDSLVGTFCGSEIPSTFKSTSNATLIKLRTVRFKINDRFRITHTSEFNLEAVVTPEVEKSAVQYLLDTKQQYVCNIDKWGPNILRTAVALFLTDSGYFTAGNETGESIANGISLKIMSNMVTKKHFSTKDLALLANAMTVACMNHKNFYGFDVVAELRKRVNKSNQINPFFVLALCNAGDNMTMEYVHKLQRLFNRQSRLSLTGTQAMIIMALKCMSRQEHIHLNVTLKDMVSEIKKKQQSNGTVENVKTTALAVQAILATENYKRNFNVSMAIRSLLKELQQGDLGIEEMFYILPILKWKTLLDINSYHCVKCNKTDFEEEENVVEVKQEKLIQVQISVILGDHKVFNYTRKVITPLSSSLHQALERMSLMDPDYKVQFIISEGKPYISALGSFKDSVEDGLFWFIYRKPLLSDGDLVLVPQSPVDIEVSETDEIILWRRSEL